MAFTTKSSKFNIRAMFALVAALCLAVFGGSYSSAGADTGLMAQSTELHGASFSSFSFSLDFAPVAVGVDAAKLTLTTRRTRTQLKFRAGEREGATAPLTGGGGGWGGEATSWSQKKGWWGMSKGRWLLLILGFIVALALWMVVPWPCFQADGGECCSMDSTFWPAMCRDDGTATPA